MKRMVTEIVPESFELATELVNMEARADDGQLTEMFICE